MNFTMRPVTEEGVRKIKLGEGLVFSVDALPPDLRRRWDIACAHIERGDNVAGALKAMTREAVGAPVAPDHDADRAPHTAVGV